MLKIIAKLNGAVRPTFMNTFAVLEEESFLTRQPAKGSFVSLRAEILFDDFGVISHNTVGVLLEAPSRFIMSDEFAVDWPGAGIIIHSIDTLHFVAAPVGMTPAVAA